MTDDSPSVIPMIETAHDIVSVSNEVIAAFESGQDVSKDIVLTVMKSQVEAFSALFEHHLKVIDMLEDLIAKIENAKEEKS